MAATPLAPPPTTRSSLPPRNVVVSVAIAVISGMLAWRMAAEVVDEGRGVCGLLKEERFGLRSSRILLPQKGITGGTLIVSDGRIESFVDDSEEDPKRELNGKVVDLGDKVIMPGLIDVHVHLNDPGRSEWEGFETGTRAAAAGGITTVVDMPLNSVPSTVDETSMLQKLAASYGKLMVDVVHWGGLVPDNADDLEVLRGLLDSGVAGLKAFLPYPGTEEFQNVNRTHIENALPLLEEKGLPLLAHAELEAPVEDTGGHPRKYSTYLATRPPEWEREAIKMLIDIWRQKKPSTRLHIVHLSDAESLPMILEAKEEGLNITVETAPHYLYFSSEEIPLGSTVHKCAPPIRSESNREKLWSAIEDGHIDIVASDHSPAPPEDKELESGDFLKAWGGISSLQLGLPITWAEASNREISLERLTSLWSEQPARLAGLKKKGYFAPGMDADIVVWDPEREVSIDDDYEIHHKHPQTPYRGSKLSGKVILTFVRGQLLYRKGKHAPRACGQALLRGEDF